MPMSLFRLSAGLVFLLSVQAASAPAQANEAAALNDPSRIVAIGGAVTEIIYALGEGEKLVARDSTSFYPAEATALPDVGYMRQLSPESVLSLDPTGIIALEGSGPKETVDLLKAASIDYVEITESFAREGFAERIRAVGKALGQDDRAEDLALSVEEKLTSVEAATDGIAERKRILFILSLQGGRIMASGTGTAADGIIKLAGGLNVMEDFQGYKQVVDEAVISAAPDVILMMDRTGSHAMADEELFAHPALAPTPAAAERRIIRMDGAYLLGFGPRTVDAIGELSQALYGNAASD